MRGYERQKFFGIGVVVIGIGMLFGFGDSNPRGGYLPNTQGVSHYTYANGEYIPVPYAYNPVPEVSTFHYRNPPVFGNNLDQLQGSTPGLYARPFTPRIPYFYR